MTGVEQSNTNSAVSATFPQPKLLPIDERYNPEHHTNSWALPSLAVKCARAFFAGNSRATQYSYSFRLSPFSEQNSVSNSGFSFFISTLFFRNEDGLFEAKQRLSCSSAPLSASTSEKGASCVIDIALDALWLSPKGETTLTDEELDTVAANICKKGIDFLEPLEAGFMAVHNDLKDGRGFRPNKAVDMCHDVLESYQSQQQVWRSQHVKYSVMDTPQTSYVVQTPVQHLGQQYLETIGFHRAVIAIGSNIGNRVANIEQSLQAMRRKGIQIRSTSFLYETEAMYYEDQDHFLNCVCEVGQRLTTFVVPC